MSPACSLFPKMLIIFERVDANRGFPGKKEFRRKVKNSWRYGAGWVWMTLSVQAQFESVSSEFDGIVGDHSY